MPPRGAGPELSLSMFLMVSSLTMSLLVFVKNKYGNLFQNVFQRQFKLQNENATIEIYKVKKK